MLFSSLSISLLLFVCIGDFAVAPPPPAPAPVQKSPTQQVPPDKGKNEVPKATKAIVMKPKIVEKPATKPKQNKEVPKAVKADPVPKQATKPPDSTPKEPKKVTQKLKIVSKKLEPVSAPTKANGIQKKPAAAPKKSVVTPVKPEEAPKKLAEPVSKPPLKGETKKTSEQPKVVKKVTTPQMIVEKKVAEAKIVLNDQKGTANSATTSTIRLKDVTKKPEPPKLANYQKQEPDVTYPNPKTEASKPKSRIIIAKDVKVVKPGEKPAKHQPQPASTEETPWYIRNFNQNMEVLKSKIPKADKPTVPAPTQQMKPVIQKPNSALAEKQPPVPTKSPAQKPVEASFEAKSKINLLPTQPRTQTTGNEVPSQQFTPASNAPLQFSTAKEQVGPSEIDAKDGELPPYLRPMYLQSSMTGIRVSEPVQSQSQQPPKPPTPNSSPKPPTQLSSPPSKPPVDKPVRGEYFLSEEREQENESDGKKLVNLDPPDSIPAQSEPDKQSVEIQQVSKSEEKDEKQENTAIQKTEPKNMAIISSSVSTERMDPTSQDSESKEPFKQTVAPSEKFGVPVPRTEFRMSEQKETAQVNENTSRQSESDEVTSFEAETDSPTQTSPVTAAKNPKKPQQKDYITIHNPTDVDTKGDKLPDGLQQESAVDIQHDAVFSKPLEEIKSDISGSLNNKNATTVESQSTLAQPMPSAVSLAKYTSPVAHSVIETSQSSNDAPNLNQEKTIPAPTNPRTEIPSPDAKPIERTSTQINGTAESSSYSATETAIKNFEPPTDSKGAPPRTSESVASAGVLLPGPTRAKCKSLASKKASFSSSVLQKTSEGPNLAAPHNAVKSLNMEASSKKTKQAKKSESVVAAESIKYKTGTLSSKGHEMLQAASSYAPTGSSAGRCFYLVFTLLALLGAFF